MLHVIYHIVVLPARVAEARAKPAAGQLFQDCVRTLSREGYLGVSDKLWFRFDEFSVNQEVGDCFLDAFRNKRLVRFQKGYARCGRQVRPCAQLRSRS